MSAWVVQCLRQRDPTRPCSQSPQHPRTRSLSTLFRATDRTLCQIKNGQDPNFHQASFGFNEFLRHHFHDQNLRVAQGFDGWNERREQVVLVSPPLLRIFAPTFPLKPWDGLHSKWDGSGYRLRITVSQIDISQIDIEHVIANPIHAAPTNKQNLN